MSVFENTEVAFKSKSNNELRKAHVMFEAVDKNWITDFGAWSLPWAIHIPGVKSLMKKTIFAYFCGGETRSETMQTVDRLYDRKVKSILDYSVEGKEDEAEYDHCFEEIMANIDIAKGNKKIPFVVFKPTGFGEIGIYTKVGANEKLTPEESKKWDRIRYRFEEVCRKSFENDVTIMVDAEETWMQDAADHLVEELMQKYNKNRCIVVNTLQMYRHDRLGYLCLLYTSPSPRD